MKILGRLRRKVQWGNGDVTMEPFLSAAVNKRTSKMEKFPLVFTENLEFDEIREEGRHVNIVFRGSDGKQYSTSPSEGSKILQSLLGKGGNQLLLYTFKKKYNQIFIAPVEEEWVRGNSEKVDKILSVLKESAKRSSPELRDLKLILKSQKLI